MIKILFAVKVDKPILLANNILPNYVFYLKKNAVTLLWRNLKSCFQFIRLLKFAEKSTPK